MPIPNPLILNWTGLMTLKSVAKPAIADLAGFDFILIIKFSGLDKHITIPVVVTLLVVELSGSSENMEIPIAEMTEMPEVAEVIEVVEEDQKVHFFPTIDEIVNNAAEKKCDECGRIFQNASACRFHQLKQHQVGDVTNTNDRRIVQRKTKEPKVTLAYHCPDPWCQSKKEWFNGMRNLRQHYLRAHTEKNLACELCGYKTSMKKDLKYHRKARCSVVIENNKNLKRPFENDGQEGVETKKGIHRLPSGNRSTSKSPKPSTSTPNTTVVQPIFFIVNPENVHSVMEALQKTLNPTNINIVPAAQVPEQFDDTPIQVLPGPSTSSFATQYDAEPTTYCERGTMMKAEPLNYFDPPYGEEFGDLTPRQKNFNFQPTPQPQTRSFGTMFENVTMCNAGTSMIDESYESEFLRDIETQTPNFTIQRPGEPSSSASTTDEWTWHMTE